MLHQIGVKSKTDVFVASFAHLLQVSSGVGQIEHHLRSLTLCLQD